MSETLAQTLAEARVRGIKLGDYPGPTPESETAPLTCSARLHA
jgi:hypothetical protein